MKMRERNVHPLSVRERTENGIESFDIFSRLLKDRIIYIDQEVDSHMSSVIVAEMLYLSNQSEEDIKLYINSPGGSVVDGLAIYDTCRTIRCDVQTIGLGLCASMGAFLLSGGTKGKRFATPSARIMIHMVSGGTSGTIRDMEIRLKNAQFLNDYLADRLAIHCNKSKKVIEEAIDRDNWMTPEEAIKFGLIDKIFPFHDKTKSETKSETKSKPKK